MAPELKAFSLSPIAKLTCICKTKFQVKFTLHVLFEEEEPICYIFIRKGMLLVLGYKYRAMESDRPHISVVMVDVLFFNFTISSR